MALMVGVVLVPMATAAILIISTSIVIMMVVTISIHRIVDLISTSFLKPIKNIVIITGVSLIIVSIVVIVSFELVFITAMIVIVLLFVVSFLLRNLILKNVFFRADSIFVVLWS